MSKRCDGCHYWHDMKQEFGGTPVGQCRIGPPEASKTTRLAMWPITMNADYCHAHHPKEDEPCPSVGQ